MVTGRPNFNPLRRTVFQTTLGMVAGLTLPGLTRADVSTAGNFDADSLQMLSLKVRQFVTGEASPAVQSVLFEAAVRVALLGTNCRALGDLVQQDFDFEQTIEIHGVLFSHSEIALLLARDGSGVQWLAP